MHYKSRKLCHCLCNLMDYKSVLQNVYSVTSSLENANVRVIQEKAKIVLPW